MLKHHYNEDLKIWICLYPEASKCSITKLMFLTLLHGVRQSYYNSSCTYRAQEQVNCFVTTWNSMWLVCKASARVAKVMNFGGWNTVAWIMSAQVIYCVTHGIYFVQLINTEMTGNNESFNVVKLVLINWQVSYLFTFLLD